MHPVGRIRKCQKKGKEGTDQRTRRRPKKNLLERQWSPLRDLQKLNILSSSKRSQVRLHISVYTRKMGSGGEVIAKMDEGERQFVREW
ncbi:MAG TPA: hypothetical protein VKA49_23455 [Flavitalea sp.]|nr:hypothetical protein [Flavitalea sp.]